MCCYYNKGHKPKRTEGEITFSSPYVNLLSFTLMNPPYSQSSKQVCNQSKSKQKRKSWRDSSSCRQGSVSFVLEQQCTPKDKLSFSVVTVTGIKEAAATLKGFVYTCTSAGSLILQHHVDGRSSNSSISATRLFPCHFCAASFARHTCL